MKINKNIEATTKRLVTTDGCNIGTDQATTTIGGRIAHIRGDRSQVDFAKEIGVHKNSLGNYERDERTPDAGFFRKLMTIGYSANWVISGEGDILIKDLTPSLHPDATSGGPVDRDVLHEVIEVVEEVFVERQLQPLAPGKKADLILLLCDEIMDQEQLEGPDKQKINRLLKLIG